MLFQVLLHRLPEDAGALAVDDRHLVDARQDAGVDKLVDFEERFLGVHPPEVDLREPAPERSAASGDAGRPDAAGFDGGFAVHFDLILVLV